MKSIEDHKKQLTMPHLSDQSLERASLRLDGLEVYALVGALQAGTSVAMMQEVTIGDNGEDLYFFDTILQAFFLLCGTAATLGGIYATIMFALCSLYGKTALGMNRDDMYEYFMKKTGPYRMRAFNAFTTSLLLFCFQVVMLFGMKVSGRLKIPLCIVISVIIWLGRRDTNALIEAATPIFTGVVPIEDREDVKDVKEIKEEVKQVKPLPPPRNARTTRSSTKRKSSNTRAGKED